MATPKAPPFRPSKRFLDRRRFRALELRKRAEANRAGNRNVQTSLTPRNSSLLGTGLVIN